jgi:microcystin-dependent protein
MSYKITLTNGTTLFQLADGVVDTANTSISLIGKNSVNFGEAQNNDFVHMLEHFANSTAPPHPLTGQLWYNTANNSLSIYSVGLWEPLAVVTYSASTPPSARLANLWFDTTVNQLKIHDGTTFNTLGPEAVAGFAKTRMASESVKDVSGAEHAVIKCTLDGTVIAVLSSDDFDVSYDNTISGIPHVFSGITMNPGYSLKGYASTSSQSNSLLGSNSTNYRSASISALANSIVERDSFGGISVNTLTATTLYSNAGKISGVWNVNGSIVPLTDYGASLGSADLHWSYVYSNVFDASSVTANSVTSNNATITTLKFTNISDNFNNSISVIDKDSTLSAVSDTRLTTQKAIKSYVDSAVAAALSAMSTADFSLQSQINAFVNVPSGTILYHAGSSAPAGYLPANGSPVSKTTYYNLWLALGGEASPYGQTLQTFNLPDLRGEFIRGLDISRGVDPGRTIGSIQGSQNLSHSHASAGGTNFIIYPAVSGQARQEQEQEGGPQSYSSRTPNTDSSGGGESRPRNIALLPIIKI